MDTNPIKRYSLNPGKEDITHGIIPRILKGAYAVCQDAGDSCRWHVKRLGMSSRGLDISRIQDAGTLWMDGPNTLCLDSADPVVVSAVESQGGVTPLGKY